MRKGLNKCGFSEERVGMIAARVAEKIKLVETKTGPVIPGSLLRSVVVDAMVQERAMLKMPPTLSAVRDHAPVFYAFLEKVARSNDPLAYLRPTSEAWKAFIGLRDIL